MAYNVEKLSTIDLGRQGENLARTVEIDVSSLLAQWPDASISLLCKRKHDTVPYVAVTEVKEGMLIWPITSVETEAAGDGKIELRIVCGEVIAKSMTAVIRVTASLTGTETEVPNAAQGWVDQVLAAGSSVEANAIRAEEAAGSAEVFAGQAEEAVARAEEVVATIGDSVDQAQEASRQAGQEAAAAETSAEQARQIAEDVSAEAERIETAVTNAELAADKIDGMKVAAETLEPGVPATVTIADDGTVKTISFGIPKGDPGEKPVRGEDYWTEEDKEQVVSEAVSETLEQVKTISFYFCAESEVDENGQPVIDVPDDHTFYLVPSGEEEPNLFIEWVYLNGKWERFGSATIDLSGCVKKTDLASSSSVGVVTVHLNYGVETNSTGRLQIARATLTQIDAKISEYKPIVPLTLDYAVKKALSDSKLADTDNAWTDDEKTSARELLGAVGNEDYATATTPGVAKVGSGLRMSSGGAMTLSPATDDQITSKKAVAPITPTNLDCAVKVGVTTNTLELTNEEQAAAREWMGAVGTEDYATNEKAGLVRSAPTYGLDILPTGVIAVSQASNSNIDGKSQNRRPITPANLDYAVKVGVTTNTVPLTDEEQDAAQKWLGTGKIIDDAVVNDHTWSSQHMLEKLTMPFEASDSIVQCHPVENSPLSVKAEICPVQHLDWMSKAGNTSQVTTTGKNLYPGTDIEFTGYSTLIKDLTLVAGETYTLSADVESSDTDSTTCLLSVWGVSVNISRGTRASVSFTVQNAEGGMRFYASTSADNSSGDTAAFRNIQIETGSTATEYEPYTGGTPSPSPEYPQELVDSISAGSYYVQSTAPDGGYWQVDLSATLGGIDAYQDTLEVDSYTGKYRLVQKTKLVVLTGGMTSSNASTEDKYSVFGAILGTDHMDYTPILTDLLPSSDWIGTPTPVWSYWHASGSNGIMFPLSEVSSVSEANAWLQEHPLTVRYVMTTPVVTTGQAVHITSYSGLTALSAGRMGLTAPEPDHPCALSASSKVSLTHCGKNLITYTDNTPLVDVMGRPYKGIDISFLKGITFSVSVALRDGKTAPKDVYFAPMFNCSGYADFYASWMVQSGSVRKASVVCQPKENTQTIWLVVYNTTQYAEFFDAFDVQIELGNTITDYESFTGNGTEIDLPEGFIGGTVDMTDGSITSKMAQYQFTGDEAFNYSGSQVAGYVTVYTSAISPIPLYAPYAKITPYCTVAKGSIGLSGAANLFALNSNTSHFLRLSTGAITGYSDDWTEAEKADGVKAYLKEQYDAGTPVTIVYEVAETVEAIEPKVITAHEGLNSVYSNAKSVIVSGRESPIHTIETLTERIAALETAATTT